MFRYKVLPELNLLVIKSSGVVYFETVLGFVRMAEEEQERHGWSLKVLTFADDNLEVQLTAGDFYKIANKLSAKNTTSNQVACVGRDDYSYGMTRMWESISKTKTPQPIMGFRSVKEACAWLNVPEEPVMRALGEL